MFKKIRVQPRHNALVCSQNPPPGRHFGEAEYPQEFTHARMSQRVGCAGPLALSLFPLPQSGLAKVPTLHSSLSTLHLPGTSLFRPSNAYCQRNQRKASRKLTLPQAAITTTSGKLEARGRPSLTVARKASLSAVSGSA